MNINQIVSKIEKTVNVPVKIGTHDY
jgi:predicted metal-binding protein